MGVPQMYPFPATSYLSGQLTLAHLRHYLPESVYGRGLSVFVGVVAARHGAPSLASRAL